eukprot:1094139-Pyramimonas_sp.AAC.1
MAGIFHIRLSQTNVSMYHLTSNHTKIQTNMTDDENSSADRRTSLHLASRICPRKLLNRFSSAASRWPTHYVDTRWRTAGGCARRGRPSQKAGAFSEGKGLPRRLRWLLRRLIGSRKAKEDQIG